MYHQGNYLTPVAHRSCHPVVLLINFMDYNCLKLQMTKLWLVETLPSYVLEEVVTQWEISCSLAEEHKPFFEELVITPITSCCLTITHYSSLPFCCRLHQCGWGGGCRHNHRCHLFPWSRCSQLPAVWTVCLCPQLPWHPHGESAHWKGKYILLVMFMGTSWLKQQGLRSKFLP